MKHKTCKRLQALATAILVLAFCTLPGFVVAEEPNFGESPHKLTEGELLQMDDTSLLNTLRASGMELPDDYKAHLETAEYFVRTYAPMLLSGELKASQLPFNYDQSNQMLMNLENVLIKLQLLEPDKQAFANRYTLQNSTPIGTWSNSYTNYNCYAYSRGFTWWMNPGDQSGTYFNMTQSISDMADVVLADLTYSGFWGYKTTTKPSTLPDQWFRVICIRKDTNNVDYHFMRMYGSLNSWAHKPGGTQPLQWNYTSPGARVWSNEYVINGTAHGPTVTYESQIYYILYKGVNDPGIHPQKLTPDELRALFEG